MLGKLWHIRRVVLGLKTILKGELDHKEEFVRRTILPDSFEIGMAKLIVPGRKLMKAKVKNILV